ncbi:MAG: hypothetical protein IT454_18125 [Planctomycetes bacterium]|nr:hypothetical protein [Planctomycetota bacterium]
MQFVRTSICFVASAVFAVAQSPELPHSTASSSSDVARLCARFQAEATRTYGALGTLAKLDAEMRAAPRRGGFLPFGPYESFLEFADVSVAYQGLYQDYVEQLTLELAQAKLPMFPRAEVARTRVYESLGESYLLTESSCATPLVGGAPSSDVFTQAGSTGTSQQLQLFPYSIPGFDLTGSPDFVQVALAPYIGSTANGFFYSASFNGLVEHAGQAVSVVDNGVLLLVYMPDTVTDASSLFPASLLAYARSLDAALGLDWGVLMQILRPTFAPPSWSGSSAGGGALSPTVAQGGGCATVEDCLLAAENAYNAALASAYNDYSQHVDAAWADYTADAEANRQSTEGFFDAFSRAGWNGPLGGSSYQTWCMYVAEFEAANEAELFQDLENAKNNLKNAVCAAGKDFVDAVKDCIRDCPEWAGLGAAMDAWLANQGC